MITLTEKQSDALSDKYDGDYEKDQKFNLIFEQNGVSIGFGDQVPYEVFLKMADIVRQELRTLQKIP